MSEVDLVLKGVSVLQKATGTDEGGINYSSDQITYPSDLERVPDDAYSKTNSVASIFKIPTKLVDGLFHEDDISFDLHGEFRALFKWGENVPESWIMPVMANVYIDLGRHEKSTLTTLEIHFTAHQKPYGPPEDPRIRFTCDGHYDPAGSGDTRFHVVVEVDQNANVNVVKDNDGPQITGGDGVIRDDSPNGFGVTIEDD